MEPTIPESDAEEIRQSIFAGRKIEAIKRVREVAGLDLYHAKQMVEQLEAELRSKSPEKFAARPGGGCSTRGAAALLILIAVVLTVIWLVAP